MLITLVTHSSAAVLSGVMVILVGLIRGPRLSGLGLLCAMLVNSSSSLSWSSSEMAPMSLSVNDGAG